MKNPAQVPKGNVEDDQSELAPIRPRTHEYPVEFAKTPSHKDP